MSSQRRKSLNPANRVFQQILDEAEEKNLIGYKARSSLSWFMNRTLQLSKREFVDAEAIQRLRSKYTKNILSGQMVFFKYDPKHAETLPYYDTFPLTVIVSNDNTGFTGINFHYISSIPRAQLLDSLYTITNNKSFDEKTRFIVTYQYLNSISKYKFFKPCFKRYLYAHVRSPFIRINAPEWPIAMFLPVERFEKKNRRVVWLESMKKVK